MVKNHLTAARMFAKLMDNQFSFMGIHFGLDSILGIVPGIGDILGLILSLYLLWIGYIMELPSEKMGKMIGNIVLDTLIGSVPLVGDIGDIFFKANIKNLEILEEFAKTNLSHENVVDAEVV